MRRIQRLIFKFDLWMRLDLIGLIYPGFRFAIPRVIDILPLRGMKIYITNSNFSSGQLAFCLSMSALRIFSTMRRPPM